MYHYIKNRLEQFLYLCNIVAEHKKNLLFAAIE